MQLTRWHGYGAALLLSGGYLAWSLWGSRPPAPGQTVTAQPAPAVATMPQKIVTPRKVVVIADGPRATEKLKIEPPRQHEEVQTAVAVPVLKYGGTSTVFLNTSSGQSRTVIRATEAPWFKLERGNTAGLEAGVSADGRYYQGDYQRDVVSIKGAVLAGKAAVTAYPNSTDWRLGARLEWRW